MPNQIKTPGVYIQEIDAFGNSVVGVATAIPAFIGYTEKAISNGKSLVNAPVKIHSLNDFEAHFGKAPFTTFTLQNAAKETADTFNIAGNNYTVQANGGNYLLYNQIQLFYLNGGGECYIVSVGDYHQPIAEQDLLKGIAAINNIDDITLLVCPEATLLSTVASYGNIAQAMLQQSSVLGDRFSILDVYNGSADLSTTVISDFRNSIGGDGLSYGAAYYPFLNTTVVGQKEISYTQISNQEVLAQLLATETGSTPLKDLESKMDAAQVNTYLQTESKVFATISKAICTALNIQPPSGIMAGVYAKTDTNDGVWKAPANISPKGVLSPVVSINDSEQGNLNVDPVSGKSICALRLFAGQGTLVWGARTLDGNSNDWRYISVRRLVIYIEQSLKLAIQNYVFAPNTSNTWVSVNAMCSSFLTKLWQEGAFAGAKASDAFAVSVGLGTTMTSEDILNGIMNVSVSFSPVRPAEFIVISIQQQMGES